MGLMMERHAIKRDHGLALFEVYGLYVFDVVGFGSMAVM